MVADSSFYLSNLLLSLSSECFISVIVLLTVEFRLCFFLYFPSVFFIWWHILILSLNCLYMFSCSSSYICTLADLNSTKFNSWVSSESASLIAFFPHPLCRSYTSLFLWVSFFKPGVLPSFARGSVGCAPVLWQAAFTDGFRRAWEEPKLLPLTQTTGLWNNCCWFFSENMLQVRLIKIPMCTACEFYKGPSHIIFFVSFKVFITEIFWTEK